VGSCLGRQRLPWFGPKTPSLEIQLS
jgi:hypothetical protein